MSTSYTNHNFTSLQTNAQTLPTLEQKTVIQERERPNGEQKKHAYPHN